MRDVLGKQIRVFEVDLSISDLKIDVSNLAAGVYTLEFTNGEKSIAVKKVIIN